MRLQCLSVSIWCASTTHSRALMRWPTGISACTGAADTSLPGKTWIGAPLAAW
ncbi:hypothetical protein [Massilia sp. KIM]|uniref:hypothetical protein n=1 Tax=Massilia sp. KIM TaxID=1955422 RepID=UPI0015C3FF8B|nr:hypothetical protein [Massilia sp. KIM]